MIGNETTTTVYLVHEPLNSKNENMYVALTMLIDIHFVASDLKLPEPRLLLSL